MVGIVLISHGSLAEGLRVAAEMIMGPQEALAVLGLDPAQEMDRFRGDLEAAVREVDRGRGVLVLADLFGGSPANTAAYVLRSDVEVVCGVNLPMLLEVLGARGTTGLQELIRTATRAGTENIVRLSAMLGNG